MKDYQKFNKIKDYQNLIGAAIIAIAIIIAGASISKAIDRGAYSIGSSTHDIGTNINIVVSDLNNLLKKLVSD